MVLALLKNISIFRRPGIAELIFVKIDCHRKTGGFVASQRQEGGEIEHIRDKQQVRGRVGR